ncbi:MAG: hypothetical protein K6T65_01440 [Peptococcaceae bacterium]|nr:hypothetical protein [Peptococcaceae bacterium]
MTQKISISISEELMTSTWNTTRSGVFARLIQEAKKRRQEEEMEEWYKAIAGDDVEVYLLAQAEVVLLDRLESW